MIYNGISTGPGSQTATSFLYLNDLVVTSNGGIFVSDQFGDLSTVWAAGNHTYISQAYPTSMTFLDQAIYLVSGLSTVAVMSTSTNFTLGYLVASTFAPSTSTVNAVPPNCTFCATWRGSLILGGAPNDPQNIYASRYSAPTDWNFAATDPSAAWALNASNAGAVGEPVVSFMPYSDDLAIIFTVNNVWLLQGSPAAGGTLTHLSNSGILAWNGWCVDDQGYAYWITCAGIWKCLPLWSQYRPPERITDQSWTQFFSQLDPSKQQIQLVYDQLNKFLRVFATPFNGSQGTQLVLDMRKQGAVLPIQYQSTAGPTVSASFATGLGNYQQLLALGGEDGVVRSENVNAAPSTVSIFYCPQPICPDPTSQSLMQTLDIDLGEIPINSVIPSTAMNGTIIVTAGPTAADVGFDFSYPYTSTSTAGTVTQWVGSFALDRRQQTIYPRVSGAWFSVAISTSPGNYFSIERLIGTWLPFGMNRTYR